MNYGPIDIALAWSAILAIGLFIWFLPRIDDVRPSHGTRGDGTSSDGGAGDSGGWGGHCGDAGDAGCGGDGGGD